MRSYARDQRVVLTLDAGGTKLSFSAVRAHNELLEPVVVPTHGDHLERCLQAIIDGFRRAADIVGEPFAAISFAFPGPADYPAGIIGDLPNLPAFRGGVPLGPMLEDTFGVPVFINNDGDLFTLGEAIAGLLPEINAQLQRAGSPRRFRNLIGATLGTGLGGGFVRDGVLLLGDNSSAAELWLVRNKLDRFAPAEDGASIRAVRRTYAEAAGLDLAHVPGAREIFDIAMGVRPGQRTAALEAWRRLGEVAGDALANAATLLDGLIVIGGGLAGAHAAFMPALMRELNGKLSLFSGAEVPRLEMRACNLEDPMELKRFLTGELRELTVPGSGRRVAHDAARRIGVGTSRLGTSRAVAVGAYAFALDALDLRNGSTPAGI